MERSERGGVGDQMIDDPHLAKPSIVLALSLSLSRERSLSLSRERERERVDARHVFIRIRNYFLKKSLSLLYLLVSTLKTS